MTSIILNAQEFAVNDGETVLDTLLRNRVAIPYGCRAGACQACIMMSDGEIPDDCQLGLSQERIQEGYFLSCQCEPEQTMQLQFPSLSQEKHLATVVEKTQINPRTLRLRLSCRLRWRAGQYITLWINDRTARCYSIASVASLHNFIELHIRIYPTGAVSPYLLNTIKIGDQLAIQGPYGECVYDPKQAQQALLLIAAGTGLAPLLGLAQDALSQGHGSAVHLLFSVKRLEDFYGISELQILQQQYANFHVTLACDEAAATLTPPPELPATASYSAVLQRDFAQLRGTKVYICGGDDFVQRAQKQCFMQGASRRDIICEAFINFSPSEA